MGLGRKPGSGRAIMLIELDGDIQQGVIDEIARVPGIREARFVRLG
jgi:hypothetical protein